MDATHRQSCYPCYGAVWANIIQEDQDGTANVTHHGAADITVPLHDPLAQRHLDVVVSGDCAIVAHGIMWVTTTRLENVHNAEGSSR